MSSKRCGHFQCVHAPPLTLAVRTAETDFVASFVERRWRRKHFHAEVKVVPLKKTLKLVRGNLGFCIQQAKHLSASLTDV